MTNDYFKDLESFKWAFGLEECGRRKNRIFLQAYKHALKTGRGAQFREELSYISIAMLKRRIQQDMIDSGRKELSLAGVTFASDKFSIDDRMGLCDDLDETAIRYVNEAGRVYKMKAGKFARAILNENGMIEKWGEVICNTLIEDFTTSWKSVASNMNLELVVDDDFSTIYSSEYYASDETMGSCMTDENQEEFYEDVDASAASIRNKDGEIIARCIVFNDVYDETLDKSIRVAERQYAIGGEARYKSRLVSMLIDAGYIDAYKSFNAGAGDSDAFLANDGSCMKHHKLSIKCTVGHGDTLSYQDSFKWYNESISTAYNYAASGADGCLSSTDSTYESVGRNFDELNDEYTNDDLITVGRWSSWHGVYDEVETSETYAEWNMSWVEPLGMYVDEAYYSEIMDEDLPLDQYEEIEQEWKEHNWCYDTYNNEWVEETTSCYIWNSSSEDYDIVDVETSYAEQNFELYEGDYYDILDNDTDAPIGAELVLEEEF